MATNSGAATRRDHARPPREGPRRWSPSSRGFPETIERYMAESLEASGSRLKDFVPLFVHRFARERLRALGQVRDDHQGRPEVLFVCVQNAGRSQMAAACSTLADGRVHVRSAGSEPADQINPTWSRRWRGRRRRLQGVPEADDRRGRAGRRRGDHDGLRRRLPDLSGKALRGLGGRRSRRQADLEGVRRIRDEISRARAQAPGRGRTRERRECRRPDLARRAPRRGPGRLRPRVRRMRRDRRRRRSTAAQLGTVGIALAFGLVIMVMVYATGHLSGAHINPAVTLAFTLSRHFPPREAARLHRGAVRRGDRGGLGVAGDLARSARRARGDAPRASESAAPWCTRPSSAPS